MTEYTNEWGDQATYTIKTAAARTEKSTRTIKRWMRDGMPYRIVAGIAVVDHLELMKFWRTKMVSNPNRTRRTVLNGTVSPEIVRLP